MSLTAVSAFDDPCIRMSDDHRSAIAVDPGQPEPVLAALDARRLTLAAILVTRRLADRGGDMRASR